MSPNAVNNFVSDLVLMAQAVEELPKVKEELEHALAKNLAYENMIQSRDADLDQSRTYAATLEQKVRDTEASRDDAELRFLELDERAAKAVRFLAQVQGMAVQAELELTPPKPQPEPIPEAKAWTPQDLINAGATEAGYSEPVVSEVKPIEMDPIQSATSMDKQSGDVPLIAENVGNAGQGQSEPDPIASASVLTGEPVPIQDLNASTNVEGSEGAISQAVTDNTISGFGPYTSRRYIDYPGWVSREDWLAGGGTNEDYDYRPDPIRPIF